jgi:multidrug efflux pump subunit AcrA (membrane-fusion protein)
MNRVSIGASSALAGAILAVVGLWFGGWLHFGMAEMDAMETSSMTMDAESMEMDHSSHDATDQSGGMTPATAVDETDHSARAMPGGGETETMGEEVTSAMPEGAVMISPDRQQLIGVRRAVVTTEDVTRQIRTVGRVDYDETRVAHIHTRVSGWIEQLHVDFTGRQVEQNEPLLEIYSPELVSTQEEYLLALRARDTLGGSTFDEVASTSRSLLEATRRRLLLWDVTPEQIEELEERREPQTALTLYSPIRGYVIHKNAYEGLHVTPNTELFSIADLTQVWVLADVYESDLPLVRPGQRATISLSYMPGQSFVGVVDYVYPYLEGETRTATVRLVLDNQDLALKPDMFANVELTSRLGRWLVVPEDAVIDTGERQVVFLALDGGHFLAREVRTGVRFDNKLQILDGLAEGDVVVSGAAFLIDSESKLRSAVGMAGHQH